MKFTIVQKTTPLEIMNNPKKQLSCTVWLAIGTACLMLVGCRNEIYSDPGTPRTPLSPPPIAGQPVTDTMATEATAEAVKHFNVKVTAPAGSQAEGFRQYVEGQLAAGGYKICTNSTSPDITVSLGSVNTSEFDRAGNYIRYEGALTVGVTREWEGKRTGFENVSVRSKRGLGEDVAMRNLNAELSAAAADFAVRAARPDMTGLAAMDVTIRRPFIQGRDGVLYNDDSAYAQLFINTVRSLKGTVYCAMVAHDYNSRTMVFRIVYLADAMPAGILDSLITVTGPDENGRSRPTR
jgi:hypothetical protein